jgi:hypothetical protein
MVDYMRFNIINYRLVLICRVLSVGPVEIHFQMCLKLEINMQPRTFDNG